MRKLTGLFIAAAVAGGVWWQLPHQAGRPLAAQTGRPSSGDSSGASTGVRVQTPPGAAYSDAARRLMAQAQAEARKGNTAEAKRLALQASRFPVQWTQGEVSPSQLLQQLNGGAAPAARLNPGAIAGRQTVPTRPEPVAQASGVPSWSTLPSGASNSSPIQQAGGSSAVQGTGTGTDEGIRQVGYKAPPTAQPSTATDPLKRRVDDYMIRAYAAWQSGDHQEALRLASVADVLAEGTNFAAGEETPAAFIARVRGGQAPKGRPQPAPAAEPEEAFVRNVPALPVPAPAPGAVQSSPVNLVEYQPGDSPADAADPLTEAPALMPTITAAGSSAAATRSTEPGLLPAQEKSAGVNPAQQQIAAQRKEYASGLMAAAREDMLSGQLEAAYEKALLAAQSDVAWNLFEETPEQLVAEIARRQKQSARTAPPSLVRNEPQPEPLGDVIEIQDPPAQAMPEKSTAASGPLTDREAARNLLAEARSLLAEGRFDEARSAAFAAKNLPVTYSLFEDRPEQVLRDIDRASGTLTLTDAAPARQTPGQLLPSINPRNASSTPAAGQPAGPATEPEFAQSQTHDRAQQLLKDARGRMRAGDFETARSLAQEAQKLNTSYSLFDERPEVVLADIDRLQSRAVQTASAGSLGASMAAAAPVSRPQAAVPTTPPSTTDRKPALLPDNLSQPQVKNPFETAAAPSTPAASDLLPQATKVAQAPQAAPAAVTGKPSEDQQKAARLLAEARELVQQNRLDEARAKAEQASQLDVVYDLFADQPSDVLAEIARLDRPAGNTQIAQKDSSPAPQPAAPDVSTQREQARQILEEARAELSAGQYEAALAMAEYVRGMDLTFGTQDDRPELVINDALKMKAQAELAATGSRAPSLPMEPAAAPPSDDAVVADTGLGSRVGDPGKLPGGRSLPLAGYPAVKPGDNITILHPSGQSADALFRQGQQLLRQGDRQGAHQAFLSAWQSGQKLDAYRSQQLQDYLRELAPKRTGAVQLTSGEQPQAGAAPEIPSFEDARPIDIAAQRDQLKFDRLRTETLNAMLRADTLREKRPDQALEVLDQALAEVENSGYETEQVAPLVRQLRRSRESIEGYMAQRAPIIELNKRNEEVKSQIDRERDAKVRVEKEFASLVDEYNRLYREKRYADAGMIARQAKELDPTNPVAVNMELKAKLAFRIDSNDKLRDNKEESFWKQLDDVEQAAIVKVGDANPAIFPDNWEALSRMRAGRYRNDNRNRTETEKKIEESLNQKISLHYENAKLIEVIQYIRTATGMNVVIDQPAIEDEGVTTESVVSIDVNDIMVQSALNLLLNPINLGYSIENESLLITSQIRQQGRLVPAVYPVADLVVSMRDLGGPRSPFYSLDGANQSVSPGMQNGGLFQVGPNANPASFVSNQGGLDASLNGSAQNQYDFNTLVDLITSVVEPDSWQEVGGLGTIKSNETTLSLVIRQTRQVHDEISDLLDQLRRLQDLQVTIEVRLINVSDRFFERIGIDFDFDLQDTVGGPDFITGGGTQGGGGGGGQQQQGTLTPIPPFGTVLATQQQGQQQQGQQQGQQQQQGSTAAQFFTPQPQREFTDRDRYQNGGTIIGLSSPNTFTPDLDVSFQQGSFDIGVPDFGNFMPNAGLQVGLAILSDIETFFFINAAQGDERSNILFAPKVTLFNGGRATISDSVQRPFVVSLQPTVGAFSVGFSPQIQLINDGISLTVTAVVSADRRFVRLALQPFFNNLIDLQTFSFIGGTGGGLGGGGQAGGQQGGGGFGGGGQGGFGGGQGGGQFGVGGIGGGPGMGPAGAMALSRFGRALGGGQLVGQNPQFGFGGIGGIGGGLGGGGGGLGGGGLGGGQQQGQAQGGLAGVTATVQQPIIASITVSTSVSVPDGGTVLLGGVKRLREGRNMAGVPILNKIPYISRLFKNSGVGRETESLMLMVTPRIVIYEEEMELLGVDTE